MEDPKKEEEDKKRWPIPSGIIKLQLNFLRYKNISLRISINLIFPLLRKHLKKMK